MTNTEMLNDIIKQRGIKKAYLAKCIGLSPTSLGSKINNRAEFKSCEIVTICDILGIRDPALLCKIFFDMK